MSIDLPDDIYNEETPRKIYRIHDKDCAPIFFGRTCRYRFDDPEKVFGVLYAAVNREGAFVEAVLRHRLFEKLDVIPILPTHEPTSPTNFALPARGNQHAPPVRGPAAE